MGCFPLESPILVVFDTPLKVIKQHSHHSIEYQHIHFLLALIRHLYVDLAYLVLSYDSLVLLKGIVQILSLNESLLGQEQ